MKINFAKQFSLQEDQAGPGEVRERIQSGAKVTGTNMYILIFAILTACIGLNMNSTPIVIGAMLISPLMGTIISIAYGFYTADLQWMQRSFKAFIFQISVGIVTSTLYFFLSPISFFSSELIARTKPNIWDVLIAILGGSAAIIANTRKSYLGNVISGTAIATALMPPLCTIGYCLAAQEWLSALGACYLFTINTIFICMSSLVGLRLMKVAKDKKILTTVKSRIIFTALLLLMIVPSGFLAWQAVRESAVLRDFHVFLKAEFQMENTQIVTSNIDIGDKVLQISVIGSPIPEEQLEDIREDLGDYSLGDYELQVFQTNVEQGISGEELEGLFAAHELGQEGSALTAKINELKLLLKVYTDGEALAEDVADEIRILFPEIEASGITVMHDPDGTEVRCLVLNVEEKPGRKTREKIREWIGRRMDEEIPVLYAAP